jgi:hypothetical protein
MKVTNGIIYAAREPLQSILSEKFPVKTSYGLVKLATKLSEQFKIIEDVRNGLIKKYGKEKANKQFTVEQESEEFPKFVDEFNELMAQEVEVDITKVKLPEKVAATCDKCHHNMGKAYEIEPRILMALDSFIEL